MEPRGSMEAASRLPMTISGSPFFDPSDPPGSSPPPMEAERKILDHGYLKLIEYWGSDQRIVESARMSTSRSFVSWEPYRRCERCDHIEQGPLHSGSGLNHPCSRGHVTHAFKDFPKGDLGILGYLWKNAHATPFEMAGLTIEVQAPIFVFREWHRHRVPFGYSELSARYAPMPCLHYKPSLERMFMGGGHLTRQASGADGAAVLTEDAALDWLARLEEHYAREELLYQHGLSIGVPKELARLPVSVARYSRMRATGNLRGWLAFNKLRFADTAQYEIRVFAAFVDQLISDLFPRTHQVVEEAKQLATTWTGP